MMNNLKKIRSILIVLLIPLMILSKPQMSFGTDEIVVKPYNSEWVLVKKTAFDYFMNQYNEYKVKYERSAEVREKEREAWLLERSILKEALDLSNEKNNVYESELLRLNTVITSMASREKIKDVALIASLIGNIINAIR